MDTNCNDKSVYEEDPILKGYMDEFDHLKTDKVQGMPNTVNSQENDKTIPVENKKNHSTRQRKNGLQPVDKDDREQLVRMEFKVPSDVYYLFKFFAFRLRSTKSHSSLLTELVRYKNYEALRNIMADKGIKFEPLEGVIKMMREE